MTKLLFTIAFSLFCLMGNAQTPFVKGKKYRIESNFDKSMWKRDGAVGLGANHGGTTATYYVVGSSYTSDCWWYIEDVGNGLYTVQNASTGKYLTMVKKYEDMSLLDAPTDMSKWRIKNLNGGIAFYNNSLEPLYLSFEKTSKVETPTNYNLTGFKKESTQPFYVMNVYDESGNEVSPNDIPELDYASISPKIPSKPEPYAWRGYAKDVKLNGKDLTYAEIFTDGKTSKFFLAELPTGNLDFQYTKVDKDITLEMRDGETVVTSADNLSTEKVYTLNVIKNGEVKVYLALRFSTLPIVTILHDGSLQTGMEDYVWGQFNLWENYSSETISLSARFKTRGATGSKSPKCGITVKFRELGTDAEKDTTLLGIRSANNWVLDGAPVDYTNMRNRVAFDIWNELYKLPYETSFNGRTGTEGKYVEVVINGKYKGLYCLTDRINRKLLNLKKPDAVTNKARGLLAKDGLGDQCNFDRKGYNQFMERYGDTRNTAFWLDWELKEPEDYPSAETWKRISDLYDFEGNLAYYRSNFLWQTNVVDYHLFIMALSILDNGNKNEYVAIKNMESTNPDYQKMFFIPWDLDTALGGDAQLINRDGNYGNPESTHVRASVVGIKELRINQNYPFKTFLNDTEYMNLLKNRWKETRYTAFSWWNIAKKMQYYANLFVTSGAYARQSLARDLTYAPDIKKEVKSICEWYAIQIEAMDDFFGIAHDPSGISDVERENDNQKTTYDLQGRKVENPQKGIYIKNGKKYLVK